MTAVVDRAQSLIQLHELQFTYAPEQGATFALEIAELAVNAGEFVACIGPSGTGKTTLINLIAGILLPTTGRVLIDGCTISQLSDTARRAYRIANIGMVFQEFALLEYLSAFENIFLPYHLTGSLVLSGAVRQRGRALAEAMGIAHVLKRRPARLSQGERQRVALCRALVTQPRLIIADEPTGNLDPDTAALTLDLLFAQVRRSGATLLMVTHNHQLLERFERVIDIAEVSRFRTPRGSRARPGTPPDDVGGKLTPGT